jgi:pimeloyl-ACP methyl ester carboxylesterase
MFVNANGISLFYELKGQGEPLLLLHGNSEDHHIFDPIVKKFSVNFTTYAIDSRNHGQSQQTNVFKYEPMAEDIYNFIKALNLGKVNLLGFSDGAILSIMLAKNHPETVKKMALLGPNLKPDDLKDEGRKIVEQLYELNKSPLFKMIF